ncbi:MAG: DNA-directed RNA polymerase subunit alpha [Candidatus Harrisonbacteria bacterium CG10_big_fil_rev_8_21_14_0_10_49_15]|uniref:DNA-directed RNA polymerase subunit alpha n=1 Tax=Candidatus Harrisonbacteria bacterium CG10_big_fil_rev_8_21_14_0_10_49_15 TaxID=1974587 RepID=A0A2H0UJR2_9BACT|nr:MAG: DNA-directed RNA polymerase subunit alpha [Candidatus Harrisonbacteria bacterium CG10_big_fil_rev_8_21_14_0_10_49_15]
MEKINLTENITIKTVEDTATRGVFDIEGLYHGYGLTVGNALRRVLLSSLPGAAITQIKIKGVGHEFSTIKGVLEDVVELTLNLKKIRFNFDGGSEPETLTLKAKGEGEVTGKDISHTGRAEVVNKDAHIATISEKGTELEIEITVERGLGYVPSEAFKKETLPVGVIQLDATFSPVKSVNFTVEDMRVGGYTDYNRVRFVIETDGGITATEAMARGTQIFKEHVDAIANQLGGAPSASPVMEEDEEVVEKPKKKATKKK